MMKAAGIQPGGQVALGVAQRSVLGNPGGASANVGAPNAATLQARGRDAFRAAIVKRQTGQVDQSGQLQQGQTGQTQQGQTGQIDPTQQGQAGQTQQGQTGQIDPTQQGQTGQIDPTQQGQTGQTDPTQQQGQTPQGTGQQTGTNQGTGQTQQGTGQQTGTNQGTGQNQQGTPTNGNNPVATQLLLAPTFTPIQANVVLDPVNMRVAFPVSQVDGEYILTMQMGGAQAAPAAQGAQPAEPLKPASANGTAPAEPKMKRADPSTETNPAKGQVYITMREVNRLVDMQSWGMQAPISQMMTDFVKASNGTEKA